MKGSGTLLNPSPPFYLVSGTQLYNVYGTSANLDRFLYSPRKKHSWFYELGWESIKIQLHTSKGNLNSLRIGPLLKGDMISDDGSLTGFNNVPFSWIYEPGLLYLTDRFSVSVTGWSLEQLFLGRYGLWKA